MPGAVARAGQGPNVAAKTDLVSCPFGKNFWEIAVLGKPFGKVPNII